MKRKTKNIILAVLFTIITITACTSIYFVLQKNNDAGYMHELSLGELKIKIDNKDSFVLTIIQTGCSHCEAFMPVATKIANEYKVDLYYINQTSLANDEEKTYLKNVANISGTPTTVFLIGGEEKQTADRLVGDIPEYKLIEKLKNKGIIYEE